LASGAKPEFFSELGNVFADRRMAATRPPGDGAE